MFEFMYSSSLLNLLSVTGVGFLIKWCLSTSVKVMRFSLLRPKRNRSPGCACGKPLCISTKP